MVSPHRLPTFQIKKVWAKNFRSILDTSADLEQLTVFVGPNASGKSNLLDILRFIKDALRFDLEAAIYTRQGIGAIHRQESQNGFADIEIGIIAGVRGYHWDDTLDIEYGFSLSIAQDGGYKVNREYAKIWNGGDDNAEVTFRICEGNLTHPNSLNLQGSQQPLFEDETNTDFDTTDLALPTLLRITRRRVMQDAGQSELTTQAVHSALSHLHRNLLNMRFYHIFPNTIREPQKLGSSFPLEEDAGNLASVLRDMEKERPQRMARLKESLGRLIPGVSDLEVTAAGGYLVIRLRHDAVPGSAWFDLSLESDGTVRLVALLTALYQHRNPPLIGIEEPELTVHPGALSVLADLFNEAANRSQLVVTTHSPDFIDCVTDYRAVKSLRIVELVNGVTKVGQVPETQIKAVSQHLFSPGELHRMGELGLY